MNLKRILVSCIAACMLLVSVPKSAHAYDYVRDIYPTTITLVASALSNEVIDDPDFIVGGFRWTQMLSDDDHQQYKVEEEPQNEPRLMCSLRELLSTDDDAPDPQV